MSKRKQEQLRVEMNDAEAQQIFNAAVEAVPGFEVPEEIAVPERRLLIGAASLAIGDREFTRALLRHLKGDDHLLLATRHFLFTGDDATARDQLPKMLASLPESMPFSEMHEVAMALESLGHAQAATDLRSRSANAVRRLLPDYEAGDCNLLPAANAADTVLTLMHGMLGVMPDAPRGRLRLRLRLPDWLDQMTVHNLHLGDALIILQYAREGNSVGYTIEQVAGAMPVRLIFEPTFTRRIGDVIVDGEKAELDLQPLTDRVVAPVQLMLDNARTLRFDLY